MAEKSGRFAIVAPEIENYEEYRDREGKYEVHPFFPNTQQPRHYDQGRAQPYSPPNVPEGLLTCRVYGQDQKSDYRDNALAKQFHALTLSSNPQRDDTPHLLLCERSGFRP